LLVWIRQNLAGYLFGDVLGEHPVEQLVGDQQLVVEPFEAEVGTHPSDQLDLLEWLGQKVVGPSSKGCQLLLHCSLPSEQDDRGHLQVWASTQGAGQL
jgi:hypothetical protein